MSCSDTIADMLTRIRNALMAGRDIVEIPHSRMKADIARILKREGYVTDYVVEGGKKKILRVYLKYTEGRTAAIRGIKKDSTPGLRHYVSAEEVPKVLGGMGIAILTTSDGVVTDAEAREKRIGGEVLCSVW